MRTRAELLVFACLVVGCGSDSSQDTKPVGGAQPTVAATPEPEEAAEIFIDKPSDGKTVRNRSLVVSGTGSPDGSDVVVEIITDQNDKDDVVEDATIENGKWSARLPVPGDDGERTVMVSLAEFDVFDTRDITVDAGPTKAQRARRANFDKLLTDKGAVGLSRGQVRNAIGNPDDKQEINGEQLWYYEHDGETFQLVFNGSGQVVQVNFF